MYGTGLPGVAGGTIANLKVADQAAPGAALLHCAITIFLNRFFTRI